MDPLDFLLASPLFSNQDEDIVQVFLLFCTILSYNHVTSTIGTITIVSYYKLFAFPIFFFGMVHMMQHT
jgi:hypothetical protein